MTLYGHINFVNRFILNRVVASPNFCDKAGEVFHMHFESNWLVGQKWMCTWNLIILGQGKFNFPLGFWSWGYQVALWNNFVVPSDHLWNFQGGSACVVLGECIADLGFN